MRLDCRHTASQAIYDRSCLCRVDAVCRWLSESGRVRTIIRGAKGETSRVGCVPWSTASAFGASCSRARISVIQSEVEFSDFSFRLEKARAAVERMCAGRYLRAWRGALACIEERHVRAVDSDRRRCLRRVLLNWRRVARLSTATEECLLQRIQPCFDRLILRQCIRNWKLAISDNRARKAREARVLHLKSRALQLLSELSPTPQH